MMVQMHQCTTSKSAPVYVMLVKFVLYVIILSPTEFLLSKILP